MTSNFEIFDVNYTNLQTDAEYQSSTQRQNGVLVSALPEQGLYNKAFRQATTMAYALGQVLSDQGFNVSDASPANLVTALTSQLALTLPKGYMHGPSVKYSNSHAVIIPAGQSARSSDNTSDIDVVSDLTVSLEAAGENGLDTGSELADTWYYLYLIKNITSGVVAGLWSSVNESDTGAVTLPAGYTVKRQLPFAARNDNSSDIIPFNIGQGWPHNPFISYNVNGGGLEVGPTSLLNTTSASTSFVDLSAANFIPPVSRMGYFRSFIGINNDPQLHLRTKGALHDGVSVKIYSNGAAGNASMFLATDANQVIQYKSTQASLTALTVAVMGFTVTEVH